MKAILSSEEKENPQDPQKKKKTYKAIKPTNIKRCIYMKSTKQKTHFSLIVWRRNSARKYKYNYDKHFKKIQFSTFK